MERQDKLDGAEYHQTRADQQQQKQPAKQQQPQPQPQSIESQQPPHPSTNSDGEAKSTTVASSSIATRKTITAAVGIITIVTEKNAEDEDELLAAESSSVGSAVSTWHHDTLMIMHNPVNNEEVTMDMDTTTKAQQPQPPRSHNTKRPRPPSFPSLQYRAYKRTTTNNNNNSNRINKWEKTPISLLIRTMGYMDNDTLMIMCLVCKQIRDIIWNGQGMETNLIRIFELRPSEHENLNYIVRYNHNPCMHRIKWFVFNMNRHCQDGIKRRMLQGYQHWKIYNASRLSNYVFISQYEKLERLVSPHLRMTGIVDLDISLPVPNRITSNCALVHLVALLVPNLRKLDISNLCIDQDIMKKLSQRCPHLEALKWNKWDNDDDFDFFPANGRFLKSFKNLKKLYWDGGTISFTADIDEGRRMAVMESYPNEFIFHELCKNNPLERVSNRHARSRSFRHDRYNAAEFDPITQNVLINFVRNVPSTLVLFRSDLSTENIRMLQLERPGIELVN